MNVLDMFLKDVGLDVEYADEGNHCVVELPAQVFDDISYAINHNAYYYNKSSITLNSIKMRLRDHELGNWVQYNLKVERTGERTVITCDLVGYETVLSSGVVGLTDSIQSKNRLEI